MFASIKRLFKQPKTEKQLTIEWQRADQKSRDLRNKLQGKGIKDFPSEYEFIKAQIKVSEASVNARKARARLVRFQTRQSPGSQVSSVASRTGRKIGNGAKSVKRFFLNKVRAFRAANRRALENARKYMAERIAKISAKNPTLRTLRKWQIKAMGYAGLGIGVFLGSLHFLGENLITGTAKSVMWVQRNGTKLVALVLDYFFTGLHIIWESLVYLATFLLVGIVDVVTVLLMAIAWLLVAPFSLTRQWLNKRSETKNPTVASSPDLKATRSEKNRQRAVPVAV